MLYLFSSIVFTSLMYIIFRYMGSKNLESQPVIVINYFICAFIGLFFLPKPLPQYVQDLEFCQVFTTALLGVSFLVVFNILSRATTQLGVAGSTVVSRMSMIIPATYAIVYLGDTLTSNKIFGMLLALPAIYFTIFSGKQTELPQQQAKANILIAVLAFLGTGLVDVFIKHVQLNYMQDQTDSSGIGIAFFAAFIVGLFALFTQPKLILKTIKPHYIFTGIVLGICNYLSLFLFVKALADSTIAASVVFPINSVGIVTVSTLLAVIIFKEKVTFRKIAGILLAVLAIVLLSITKDFIRLW